jgi:hypothetical protein
MFKRAGERGTITFVSMRNHTSLTIVTVDVHKCIRSLAFLAAIVLLHYFG